ncbi:MAG: hypothetical protein ACJ79K_17970 [Gemmatimonadaceae bacterium]
MKVLRPLLLTLALGAIAGPSTASGQATQIPATLARALMAAPGEPGSSGDASFYVGSAPNGFPAAWLPPTPVTIAGGFGRAGRSTVVLVYPASEADPAAAYATFLRGAGWTSPERPPERGGFVSSELARLDYAWLCRDSARVTVLGVPGASVGAKLVRASFYRDDTGSSCGGASRSFPVQQYDLLFPTLVPPAGVQMRGGGGGSSGVDSRVDAARYRTTMAPSALIQHFAAQLEKAGWKTGALLTGDGLAVQSVEANDTKGRPWRGTLTVIALGSDLSAELRMSRTDGMY